MKRVSLDIDLEENEAFDKEVQEIIRAKVRETVRKEYNILIQESALQEYRRIFDANTYGYRDRLEETVQNCAITGIQEVLEELNVPDLIKEKAIDIIDANMERYLKDAERRCKIAFDSIVTKQAEEQIKKILG